MSLAQTALLPSTIALEEIAVTPPPIDQGHLHGRRFDIRLAVRRMVP